MGGRSKPLAYHCFLIYRKITVSTFPGFAFFCLLDYRKTTASTFPGFAFFCLPAYRKTTASTFPGFAFFCLPAYRKATASTFPGFAFFCLPFLSRKKSKSNLLRFRKADKPESVSENCLCRLCKLQPCVLHCLVLSTENGAVMIEPVVRARDIENISCDN